MGEIVQFVSKSERERKRLIQEARAIYDSIFPSADTSGEGQAKTPLGRASIGDRSTRS